MYAIKFEVFNLMEAMLIVYAYLQFCKFCVQHAIAYVSGEAYYGSTATMNVWDPWVENRLEFSLSQMWILSGSFDGDLNTIEAGWQVRFLHFSNPFRPCEGWVAQ